MSVRRVLFETASPMAICLACRTAMPSFEPCDGGPEHLVVALGAVGERLALAHAIWSGDRCAAATAAATGVIRQGVADGTPAASPLGRKLCLAFAAVARTRRPLLAGDAVLWREAGTHGFELMLDDGRGVLRVPAGRIHLEADSARFEPVPIAAARVRLPAALTDSFDGEPPLVPLDEATEVVVLPGDRVAFAGEVEPAPLPAVLAAPYRSPAVPALRPKGVPILRLQ